MSLQSRYKKSDVSSASPCSVPFNGPRMMSSEKAAEYLAVSVDRIYDLLKERKIPYVSKGTGKRPSYTIDRCDLDRWIDENKVQAA
jgi:excisionase family DNA binding protein